ncbi:type II secretion system F family protein [Methanoculleus sp.]|nr:type II secretion system F family protein [Methanoculleus sp.]
MAHIPVPYSAYLRRAVLVTAVAAGIYLACIAYLSHAGYRILLFSVVPDAVTKILLFLILIAGVFGTLYCYPFLVAQGRKTKIDLDLPYAITYMEALSTTMTVYEVIRKVYEEMDLFGEVSKEFGMTVRDVELFGEDLHTAMKNLQNTTPSPNLADFFNDLALLSDSGGDITAFLGARSGFFREIAEREQEMALKTIEIMAEVYVTAFVAGPIVVMIMILSQNLAGQSDLAGWMPLITLGIPAGAMAMIGILYTLLPAENLQISRREVGGREHLDVPDPGGEIDPWLIRTLRARNRALRVMKVLKQPFRHYISNYDWSLVLAMLCGGAATALFLLGYFDAWFPMFVPEVGICAIICASFFPVMIAYEGRRGYVNSVERQMPEFLRELADMKDIGMTLQLAIHRIANTKLGLLSSELQITSEEIRRGVSIGNALVRMEERIGLVSVKRAISLMVKASEITDHLRETLMVAINDFEHYLRMKRERFNSAFTYVAVVYLSFGVYLYTALELNTRFVSSFTKFDVTLDIAGNTTDMFHIAIVLGAFSGIMAGQLSANSIMAGFKHSIVFLIATVVVFVVLIGGAL